MADIVFGLLGVRVGLYLDMVLDEGERQRYFRYVAIVFNVELAVGSVGFQLHSAVLSSSFGEQGAEQDAGGRQKQGQHHGLFPVVVAEGQDGGHDKKNGPQRDKPPGAIDMAAGEVGAVQFFDDGACSQDGDEQYHEDGDDVS